MAPQSRNVGSLDDYDPLNGQWGSANQGGTRQQLAAAQARAAATHHSVYQQPQSQQQHQQPQHNHHQPQRHQPQHHQQPQQQHQPQQQRLSNGGGGGGGGPASPQQASRLPAGGPRVTAGGGPYFRAMYDYTAADTDEVSFLEGDVIGDCQFVDEGWMTGTVQRTKGWGMLPANYVEKIM